MKEKLSKFKITKSQIMTIVFAGIVSMVMSLGTSYASNNYLYNSNDVSYDNTVSGITATDVQGAVDELYFHAIDYSEIKNKIGNNALTTTSETLTGGINELKTTIGNGTLDTTSQNLIGAVNELDGQMVTKKQLLYVASPTTSFVKYDFNESTENFLLIVIESTWHGMTVSTHTFVGTSFANSQSSLVIQSDNDPSATYKITISEKTTTSLKVKSNLNGFGIRVYGIIRIAS